jgi:hypothetical protein
VSKWVIGGLFTLFILLFTLVVWRAQRSGGACSHASTPESYRCRLIAPENLPTDYLVIVGMGGVFVAIFTLKSIHHQAVQMRKQTTILNESADATKRAADAALLNAQAVIDADRAWIMLDSFQPEGKDFWEIVRKNALSANPVPTYVVVRFKNCGRTPAWLIESTVKLETSEMNSSKFSFDYGELFTRADGEPITPGESTPPVQVQLEPIRAEYLTVDDMVAIQEGREFLYLYGVLRYRDVFSERKLRETCFSFRYVCVPRTSNQTTIGVWDFCGPNGKNKHT